MKTKLENADWILAGIRESLEKIRDSEDNSEWNKVAEAGESWE